MQMVGAFAEFERAILRERTKKRAVFPRRRDARLQLVKWLRSHQTGTLVVWTNLTGIARREAESQ